MTENSIERNEVAPWAEWTVCAHCNLKHRERADGLCPRCGQMIAAEPDVMLQPAAQTVAADGDDDSPWKTLAGGICLLVVAFYLHGAFDELATGARESVRVWWGIAVLYHLVGPTITVALIGLVGGLVTISGVRRLF